MKKKKTAYALITQQQFHDMRAAIQEYQFLHGSACLCKACQYANQAHVPTSQKIAPIYIAPDIPWHEEEVEA